MKKFLIGLGVFFLAIIILFVCFGGYAWMQINGMMPSINDYVNRFYTASNNEKYDLIYNFMADKKFRDAGSQEDFEKYMGAVLRKMGAEKSYVRGRYAVNYMGDGTYFSVEYQTTRERGTAIEDLVLKQNKSTGEWYLIKYNINSKELIEN